MALMYNRSPVMPEKRSTPTSSVYSTKISIAHRLPVEHGKTSGEVMPESEDCVEEGYEIMLVTADDYERVIDHLREFFFKDEPLNVDVDLMEGRDTCEELEEFTRHGMSYGCSYMAVSTSNLVVGVTVNGIDRRTDPGGGGECGNPKFQKILNLLASIESEVNIFRRFPDVDAVMNCKVLSVDSAWRGRGIAKKLLDKTRDVACEMGYGLMRVDCTSHYSAKAIARLGFDCIYVKKYCDHKENGEIVFRPQAPHDQVEVYIQRIPT